MDPVFLIEPNFFSQAEEMRDAFDQRVSLAYEESSLKNIWNDWSVRGFHRPTVQRA